MVLRSILSIMIACLLLPLSLLAILYTSKIDFSYLEVNDEISLQELRENLLFIYDLSFSEYELDFIYKGKEYSLSQVNDKLIMQPGTIIYLDDIEDLSFKEEDNCIFVNYVRNNQTYSRVICQKQSLYLEQFSDCVIDSELSDSSEE